MGAKQSKRSVDITTTPKKEPEGPLEGEGKVEKIGDLEAKVTTNGTVHADLEYADKEETDKEEQTTIKENGTSESEEPGEQHPKEENGEKIDEEKQIGDDEKVIDKVDEQLNESKKGKEKTKKKKWSFRSISFSKKDKSKPSKEAEKNGEVKEVTEEVTEEGAEGVAAVVEDKPKTEESTTPEVAATPVSNAEKQEEVVKPAEPESTPPAKTEVPVVEAPKETPPPVEVAAAATVETLKEVEVAKPVEEKVVAHVEEAPPAEPTVQIAPAVAAIEVPVPVPVVEEPPTTEVRNEEIPPPLPASNPPSPVTVFAETTMTQAAEVEVPAPAPPTEVVASEDTPPEAAEPPKASDSLPDISTESLSSLPPEPSSDGLVEPMSLPPVECVPEPIANGNAGPEELATVPTPVALTNGNVETNGLPSPVSDDAGDLLIADCDRPIKQVVSVPEVLATENSVEESKDGVVADGVSEAAEPTATAVSEE